MSGKEAETKNDPSSRSTSRWMFFALLIAAIVFLVRYIAPQTVGEQVRRHIEQQLRDHYTGLDIHIGRGRFVPDRGLILEDVNFAVPLASRSRVTAIKGLLSPRSRELIHIDQLIVETQTRLERLADKQNPFVAKRMIVRGLSASVWMEADESVSLERLLPMPKLGNAPCPRMEIHDASIVLETDSKQLRPIEIVISEAVALKHRVSLQDPVEDLVLALEESHVPIYQSNIQAKGTASFAETLTLNITTTADSHQVNAKLMGARFSKDLIERLPKRYAELLQPVVGLELLADTELNVSVSPNAPLDFTAETRIRNGSFLHPKSSVPVKDIRGRVTCNTGGIRIETCQAHWGDARLHINGQTYGYSTTPRATLDVRAENVLVDRRLQAIAPPKLASVWNRFEPEGFIDVPQARFEIANGQIQTTAEIECKGVDLSYEKFPYPVQNVSGTMTMRDGRLFSEMISGRVGGQAMRCIFNVPTKAGSVDPRVISITMGGPLAIDNELLQALTPRGEEMTKLETFVRSLTPYGAINLTRATFRTDEEGRKHKDIDLDVSEGSLRYVKFPYPLSNVNGNIRVIDDDVTINDFVAANANGGTIRCSGRYQLSVSDKNGYFVEDRPAGKTLLLDFAASNVAMDESLRSSLPPKSRETWDNLSPSGVLHSLNLSMQQNAHGDELDFNILGQQFDTNRLGTDALRLQPSAVPYRLDITEGMVQYKNGRVSIDAIRAEHGRTAISADGMCEQLPSGQWLLSVNVHSNSRLIPDSELIVALPNELRGALRGLNLRGPVGFRGLTQTLLPDEIHPDPVFAWNDLVLQLEGNRIGDVGPVHALRGELTVSGRRDSQGMRASGEVRIDSMHVNDLQITSIRGPFSIEDDRLRLGSVNRDGSPGNPIGGRLFDGLIRLDGNVKLSDASFNVRLALDEAKVPVVLADLGQGKSDLSGTLGANMTLEGLLGTTDLLQGRGKASVDDANLYQLPVLVQLLNVLSISPTEDVAFTNADMDFTLIEDEIRFDYMNLEGSLIKLEGAGSLDRRQELDLTFNTRVSPRNTFTRIFRPLVDQRYTLWTVDVRGPLDDPSIERRSFDGVGETLERLFPSTGAEAARKDRMAGAGRMMQ